MGLWFYSPDLFSRAGDFDFERFREFSRDCNSASKCLKAQSTFLKPFRAAVLLAVVVDETSEDPRLGSSYSCRDDRWSWLGNGKIGFDHEKSVDRDAASMTSSSFIILTSRLLPWPAISTV